MNQDTTSPSRQIIHRISTFGRMIKFSHSVFALPFAAVAAIVAIRSHEVTLTWTDVILLLVCMVAARTAAMGFNRIVDRRIDAENPRTKQRELPSGKIRLREASLLTALAAGVFVAASFGINTECGILSLPVLALLLGYSVTKRFTAASHIVLGLCLGAAPVGVWFALTGEFSWIPILLGLGVALWTAGFDIYYSCQDVDFDRRAGLKSIPAMLGPIRAIRSVRWFHALAGILYIAFGLLAGLGIPFWIGLTAVLGILVYEAWILRRGDLSRIDLAFFNLNGYVSILFAASVALDYLIGVSG